MRDVARRQPDRLDLGQLPVCRLGRNQRPQRQEGRVDAVRPVPLASVRCPARRRRQWRFRCDVGGRRRVVWDKTTGDDRFVAAGTRQLTLQDVEGLPLLPARSARRQTKSAER